MGIYRRGCGELDQNWHEDLIAFLGGLIRPKVYVELGLYHCDLFNRMIPYAEKLIGVDMNPAAGNFMQQSEKVHFFNGTTQEFAQELQKNPLQIDLLFIDADHAKEAVLQDFYDYFPFVAPHRLILFHDTHPRDNWMMQRALCDTAYQAIEELSKDTTEYELMTLPVNPGLTLCRKRKKQLSWHE